MNWKTALLNSLSRGEGIEYCNPSIDSPEMTRDFDDGFGGIEGCAFVAFSNTHVYFPLKYEGLEWVGSAPRNYPAAPLEHQGG